MMTLRAVILLDSSSYVDVLNCYGEKNVTSHPMVTAKMNLIKLYIC